MVNAHAMRKRYILFRYSGNEIEKEELKRKIYSEALRFFGEYGFSYLGLKLMSYETGKKTGILRVQRDSLEDTLGFLAIVDSFGDESVRLIALKSSGTLKSLESTDESTHSR